MSLLASKYIQSLSVYLEIETLLSMKVKQNKCCLENTNKTQTLEIFKSFDKNVPLVRLSLVPLE
jgi:hypothetical protein